MKPRAGPRLPGTLRIDMNQGTRAQPGVLVASRRSFLLIHTPQPPRAEPREDPRQGRCRQPELLGDLDARASAAAQAFDTPHQAA